MDNNFYTFKEKRVCKHCKEPIPDQAHAATTFCPWKQLPDGTIKCCKDDYHADRYRILNAPFQAIFNLQKATTEGLTKFFNSYGDIINLEQLYQYRIDITMPVKYDVSDSKTLILFYVNFCLTQISATQFKITKHENTF